MSESEGGTYFTDGDSLWEVVGTDSDGNFYLMDCAIPAANENAQPIVVSQKELDEGYARVKTN